MPFSSSHNAQHSTTKNEFSSIKKLRNANNLLKPAFNTLCVELQHSPPPIRRADRTAARTNIVKQWMKGARASFPRSLSAKISANAAIPPIDP